MVKETKRFKRDGTVYPIQGGSEMAILEFAVASGTWTAIELPEGVFCKQFLAKTRDDTAFKISADSAGATYISLAGHIAVEIAGEGILFYVQSVEATAIIELLFVD